MSSKFKKDFSHLGAAFQKELTHLILVDRPFADQMEEVLEIQFIEYEHLQTFVNEIFKYRSTYKVHPSMSVMESLLCDASYSSDAHKKLTLDFYEEIKYNLDPSSDAEYVKDVSLDFCRKRKMYSAMRDSIKLLENKSYVEIKTLIEDALRLGSDKNVGHEYLKDFEDRYVESPRFAIPTGWDVIDDIIDGGHGAGELGVVIAPTGAGKSQVLVNVGSAALKAGKNVVHYTLELSDRVIGKRYDACISGFNIGELPTYKEEVRDAISQIPGQLIIKYYPMNKVNVQTISNHLERLKTLGTKVDMVIVDYADLLKPEKAYGEKRFDLESVYQGLRSLAQELSIPVWTASQTNRSGLNAELVTMEAISEAFNKCYVSDFIFTLSRTIADKETNTGRIFVAKNRNGADGLVFPAWIDWSKSKMRVLEPTGDSIEDITDKAAKKQEAVVDNRIAEFRQRLKNKEI